MKGISKRVLLATVSVGLLVGAAVAAGPSIILAVAPAPAAGSTETHLRLIKERQVVRPGHYVVVEGQVYWVPPNTPSPADDIVVGNTDSWVPPSQDEDPYSKCRGLNIKCGPALMP